MNEKTARYISLIITGVESIALIFFLEPLIYNMDLIGVYINFNFLLSDINVLLTVFFIIGIFIIISVFSKKIFYILMAFEAVFSAYTIITSCFYLPFIIFPSIILTIQYFYFTKRKYFVT
jgi:hypothetical protein